MKSTDLVVDLIEEALEDIALVRAMEEAEGSLLTSRVEVFEILDEPLAPPGVETG